MTKFDLPFDLVTSSMISQMRNTYFAQAHPPCNLYLAWHQYFLVKSSWHTSWQRNNTQRSKHTGWKHHHLATAGDKKNGWNKQVSHCGMIWWCYQSQMLTDLRITGSRSAKMKLKPETLISVASCLPSVASFCVMLVFSFSAHSVVPCGDSLTITRTISAVFKLHGSSPLMLLWTVLLKALRQH